MAAPIKIRCTSPMLLGGRRIEMGEVLHIAEPLKAHECIASGRAEHVDPDDAPRVRAAVAAERDRMMAGLNADERRRGEAWVLQRKRA